MISPTQLRVTEVFTILTCLILGTPSSVFRGHKSKRETTPGLADILDFNTNTRAAADFILNADTAALFIVRFVIKYFATSLLFIAINLVTWDRDDQLDLYQVIFIRICTFTGRIRSPRRS